MPKSKLRNKFESRIYTQLRLSGVKFKYESEKIPFVIASHYIPDFILSTPNGKVYVECKGYFRPEAKRKMVAVKKQRPELDIRILFYSFNKQYVKWAERQGFRYAVGTIPEDWLTGL